MNTSPAAPVAYREVTVNVIERDGGFVAVCTTPCGRRGETVGFASRREAFMASFEVVTRLSTEA